MHKIEAFGHAYLLHCTKLFHSWGGYFNSLLLHALELLPWRAKRAYAYAYAHAHAHAYAYAYAYAHAHDHAHVHAHAQAYA